MREAAIRTAPLTVLTVNEVAASFWSHHPVTVPADEALRADAQEAATELANEAAAELGDSRPASVTVTAISGFAADELVSASRGAELLVVGARGGAQSGGLAHYTPLGSISNKVLHRAECPVVVVPAPK